MSIGGGFLQRDRLVHYRCWASTRKSIGDRLMAGDSAGVQPLKTPFDRVEKPNSQQMAQPKKVAASLWGKAGRARTGLGRGGVGM
jgi:hypothetical protein